MSVPTQAEIEQQQQDVEELSAVAVAAVAAAVIAASGKDSESTLLEKIPPILIRYMSAAADLAVDWYRSLAREQPSRPPARKPGAPEPIIGPTSRISLLDAQDFEPEPVELPPREQIEATVRWAIYEPAPEVPESSATESSVVPEDRTEPEASQPEQVPTQQEPEPTEQIAPDQPQERTVRTAEEEPARARVVSADETDLRARVIPADATDEQARIISRLAGATQRYVTSAARDTITANAEEEGVRWARHAQPDACAFCRMLATRGPDYLTEESAQIVGTGRIRGPRKKGEEFHDWCQCEPVAVRAGDSYEPPDYVTAWNSQYEKAVAAVGNRFNTRAILAEMRAAEKAEGGSTR